MSEPTHSESERALVREYLRAHPTLPAAMAAWKRERGPGLPVSLWLSEAGKMLSAQRDRRDD